MGEVCVEANDQDCREGPLEKLYETVIVLKIMCIERHHNMDILPLNNPSCEYGQKRSGAKVSTCKECNFGVRIGEPTPRYNPADVLKEYYEYKKSKKSNSLRKKDCGPSIYS
jgi:hypothetical protein